MNNTILYGVGPNANIEAQVDSSFQCLRTTIKPDEFQIPGTQGGHYTMTFGYSNTAAKPAAASDVVSMRWSEPNLLFVLKRLSAWAVTTTTYTATLNQDFAAFRATGFSVAASAGTQIVPIGGGQQKNRTNQMSPSTLGNSAVLWVSSGDTLTAGTRTLDTQPFGYIAWLNPITTPNAPTFGVLYEERNTGQYPLICGVNEGIVIQTPIGNGQAAGVSKYTFVMEWAEVPVF